MMDFGKIEAIQNRIADIETRVGMRQKPTKQIASFENLLADELKTSQSEKTVKASAEKTELSPAAYASVIGEAAQKYNVDPRLISAVAEAESSFTQNAVSSAGAVGIMQLMPETAASLGINPYDAAENIDGGTHYLRQMLDTFGGDVKKAVAAYNAGPQAVKDYNGVPPYRETQGYVDKVLNLYR